jgi:predicted PurR-regulated permease PerM
MEDTAAPQSTRWPPRRIILATLAVLAVVAVFLVLFRFRLVFFSLFTAIVLSTAIEPLVTRLARWGISRPVTVILISFLVLAVIVFLVITIAPLLIQQWTTITSMVSTWYQDLHEALLGSKSLLIRRIARQLPMFLTASVPPPNLKNAVQPGASDLVQQAFNLGSSILRSILIILAVILLTGFWTIDGDRGGRFFLLAFPREQRENLRVYFEEVNKKMGAYTRGLVILSTIIGVMASIAYLIIGLPNVLMLGIIAGIMEAVPLVGPTLGAVPALLVAVSVDPSKVIWVILSTVIIQTLENNLVVPRVMDRAVGVNPVASLLAFIAFGSIFGFVGALLAVPLAAVIQLTLSRYLFQPVSPETQPPSGRDAISTLRYEAQDLVQDVRKQVREKESEADQETDQIEDTMETIVQDLDSILAVAETTNQKNGRKGRSQKS